MNTPILRFLCAVLFAMLAPLPALAQDFTEEEIATSVDVRDLDSPPRPKKQSVPPVPSSLARVQASVQVGFLIDEKGRVRKPRIIKSSNPSFNAYVLDFVRDWEFEPGKRDGAAVSVRVIVPLRFK